MKVIKIFDFFGNTFSPTVAYSEKQTSSIGGILGILYIIIGAFLAYFFGWTIIVKDKPNVTTQSLVNYDKKSNYSLPFAINNNTYAKPTLAEFLTPDEMNKKKEFLDSNIARVYDISFLFEVNINNRGIKFTKELQMEKCKPRDFTQKAETSNDYRNIDDSNCFHRSQLPGESFDLLNAGEFEYRKVIIETNNCENSTGVKEDCLSIKDQNFYTQYFSFKYDYYYPVISFNPKNFLKPFADEVEHTSMRLLIYPQPFKLTQKISVQDVVVKTDAGIFGEVLTHKYMQSIKTIKFILSESLKEFDYAKDVKRQKFHKIEFNLAAATIDIERQYPKLQTIISEIVGMMFIIAMMFKAFLQTIYDHQTRELLIHQIFHVNEDLINEIEKGLSEEQPVRAEPVNQANPGNNSSIELAKQGGDKIIDISVDIMKEAGSNVPDAQPSGKRSIFTNYLKQQYFEKDKVGKQCRALKNVNNSMEVTKLMSDKTIPKKFYSLTDKESNLLSFCDHCCLTYCCCLACGRSRKIKNFYETLELYTKDYTDICNITNNIFEMEKMKYLLMDEDQAAIFSLRTKAHVKQNLQNQSSNFSRYYYFLRDLNDFVEIDNIKCDILEREHQKTFNQRLINMTI